MIAVPRRVLPWTVTLFAAAATSAVTWGEILEFRTALGSTGAAGAEMTAVLNSVESPSVADLADPVAAFAGGSFTGSFDLGTQAPLVNPNGEDGVLAGLRRDPAAGTWATAWLLQARSDRGEVRINDVALAPGGEIYVTGVFTQDVIFDVPPPADPVVLTVGPLGQAEGFVAWADPNGAWIGAFPVPGMQPNSIALDAAGAIFLTGRPELARRYDAAGALQWRTPEPPDTASLLHIAVGSDERAGLFVLGSIDPGAAAGEPNEDVFVAQLEPGTGTVTQTIPVASPGQDRPGGLGIGPLGGVRVALSSDDPGVTVNGIAIEDRPILQAQHGHLVFLSPQGEYVRDRLLGNASARTSTIAIQDLSIDPFGNAHVAISFNGGYEFQGLPHPGQEDAGLVAIDAEGAAIRFRDTNGPSQAGGRGAAAPHPNLQILVGGLRGTEDELFDAVPLPASPEGRAFFSALEPVPDQQAFILTSDAGDPLDEMVRQIREAGGAVYRSLDLRNDPNDALDDVRIVSAFLTPRQLDTLPGFTIVEDVELLPDGTIASTWHLEALNSAPAAGSNMYTFPETCHETVLYLIDSSFDNSSGYFAGNTSLTLGASFLVRAIGEPNFATAFDHGTKILSMIAGPDYGSAQGTPVTVINYDIYPTGGTAKLSALVEAIGLANTHKASNHLYDPAVYCVASSAATPGQSASSLETVVDYALGPAVYASILVSAGNTSGDAQDYTPSDLGAKQGVICTGAIDIANSQVSNTRGDPGVDLWAPGDAVPAADTAGLLTHVGGTSSATALAAGAALAYLSGNPVVTPGDLETALVSTHGQSSSIGTIAHIPLTGVPGFSSLSDWANWYGLTHTSASGNDDGDNWTNEEEYTWGLNPLVAEYQGSIVCLGFNFSTSTLTFEFPLACSLYQPSALSAPHLLRDGSTLTIQRSENLDDWTDITNTLTLTEASHDGRQVRIQFDYSAVPTRCFFRVKIH